MLYAIWVKIDEALPWMELKEAYKNRALAYKAAKKLLGVLAVKVVRVDLKR
ncbi:hypothetical protein H5T51_00885 [Candidatus Bathyarchaeota archaeon]|nr:hypothetical protein [Candidatus Bathyarchaeota archaeon]